MKILLILVLIFSYSVLSRSVLSNQDMYYAPGLMPNIGSTLVPEYEEANKTRVYSHQDKYYIYLEGLPDTCEVYERKIYELKRRNYEIQEIQDRR